MDNCVDEAASLTSALTIASDLDRDTSPISKLNDDLIRLIFMTIIQEFRRDFFYPHYGPRPSALTTARFASQVCRSWRHLLLNSPLVWGRLIDLDSLNQKSGHWREEVLRRTQSSPLWITTSARRYLYSFLFDTKLRERIQTLDITLDEFERSDRAWETFFLPAPNLRVFKFRVNSNDRNVNNMLFEKTSSSNLSKRLFGNHAPLLSHFSADNIVLAADSLWISNLRELSVSNQPSIPEIAQILLRTPLLETLSLSFSRTRLDLPPTGILPRFELPNLTSIRLTSPFGVLVKFLESIHTSKPCSVYLYEGTAIETHDRDGILQSLKENLPRYINSYFAAYTPKCLNLGLHKGFIKRVYLEDPPCLSLGIDSEDLELIVCQGSEVMDVFLQFFFECAADDPSHFASVTKLSLHMEIDNFSSLKYFDSMLSYLSSVECLRANERSVEHMLSMITEIQADVDATRTSFSIPFPSLRSLEVIYDSETMPDYTYRSLARFLKSRKESGYPIKELKAELACRCASASVWHDLSCLEEMEGLKVLLSTYPQDVSYVCGSGEPDALRVPMICLNCDDELWCWNIDSYS